MALLQVNAQAPKHLRSWTSYGVWALVCAIAAAALIASIPIVFGTPLPQIHIQWRAISPERRTALEQRFALVEATPLSSEVWSYVPTDTSRERLLAIVSDPAVADTNGINRRSFSIADTPPLTPRRGGLLDAPPWMAGLTRMLSYLLAMISMFFFVRAASISPALGPGSQARRAVASGTSSAVRTWQSLYASLRAKSRRAGIPPSAAAAALALFGTALAWRFVTFTGFTNDHYVHLALAQQLLMGDRPIRDFIDSGWPLQYLLSAGAWQVAGDSLVVEWAIAAGGFAVGAACTVVAAYRLSGLVSVAIVVTVLEILVYPRTYSYPKVLMYAAAAWALISLARRPAPLRIVMMSALVAVAFLFRHDHGLFIGASAAVCLAAAQGKTGVQAAFRQVALLVVVTCAFLLPWALFVQLNGGLVQYFLGGIEYSREEAVATALGELPRLSLTPPLLTVPNAEAWLFWLFWGVTAVSGGALILRLVRRQERWPGESAAVAGLVAMAVLVNASFIREALQVRLPDAIVPAAVLGAWALGLCWTSRWSRRGIQLGLQLASVVVLSVSLAAISRIVDLPGQYDNTDIGRGMARAQEHAREVSEQLATRHRDNVFPPSRVSNALMPFIEYVDRCTSVSDRLLITGEFPEILVIAGRKFAGDGVVFGSWYASAANQGQTVQRLRGEPPLFVIHAGDYGGFVGRFGLVDAFVNEAYEPVTEVPVEGTDSVRILRHRNRPSIRLDPTTGWSCYR